jgi:hypothetical protein
MVWSARGTLLVNHFRMTYPAGGDPERPASFQLPVTDELVPYNVRSQELQGMAVSRGSAERRDDLAGDRDDTADHRDTTAGDRDDTAGQRDITAAMRDEDTRRELATLDDRLLRIREQNSTDPATANLTSLIDDLRSALQGLQDDGDEAAADRHAAARDRRHAARDRDGSAQDRAAAGQDRDQAAIERAQDALLSPPRSRIATRARAPGQPHTSGAGRIPTADHRQPRATRPHTARRPGSRCG